MQEIEEIAKEYCIHMFGEVRGDILAAMVKAAKWARDQQPKLKPMPWEFDKAFDVWRASTAVGEYRVRESLNRVVLPGSIFLDCTDVDHGKQLAQADYEEKCKSLLK